MAKILIVDDSTIIRRNLAIQLEGVGHEIVGEGINGVEAIKLYEERRPDLVTMDITMRFLDGVNAVKQIILRDPSAKIIMISAQNKQNQIFEAIRSGAKHYIVKPIRYNQLFKIIDSVLQQS